MTSRTSIIMPVKNGENFIEATLLSLLENTTVEDEIIIIDDGDDRNAQAPRRQSRFAKGMMNMTRRSDEAFPIDEMCSAINRIPQTATQKK